MRAAPMIRRARPFVSFPHRSLAGLRRRAAALAPCCTVATQKRTSLIQLSHVSFQLVALERRWKRFASKTALAAARVRELDCVLRGALRSMIDGDEVDDGRVSPEPVPPAARSIARECHMLRRL